MIYKVNLIVKLYSWYIFWVIHFPEMLSISDKSSNNRKNQHRQLSKPQKSYYNRKYHINWDEFAIILNVLILLCPEIAIKHEKHFYVWTK